MTKIKCPTCGLKYWDMEMAFKCCRNRRDREDAETEHKKKMKQYATTPPASVGRDREGR